MPSFTSDQVMALAPDPASAKAGRELSAARLWLRPGRRGDELLWGEHQGSGSKPYQVTIDLSEPAFNCSCPSRKFPCKHGLGLLLFFANDAAPFSAGEPPDWSKKWIDGRQQRAEKKVEKAEKRQAAEVADPEAAAKRAADRERRVADGIDVLAGWLRDLVRAGIGAAQARPSEFWTDMARRLVDSQAQGAANLVLDCHAAVGSGAGWQLRLLERIASLHLLIEGWKRLPSLPEETREDIRSQLGWAQNQDALLLHPGITDCWQVLGRAVQEDDRLTTQRTWLRGTRSGRYGLVLSFSVGAQPLDTSLLVGTQFEGELVFFPGGAPLRALVKNRQQTMRIDAPSHGTSIADALSAFGDTAAKDPWLRRFPLLLSAATPIRSGEQWQLVDAQGHSVPVRNADPDFCWSLLGLSGGRALSVCGEWDGSSLRPISAWRDREVLTE
jgi:hypothetical protein